MLTQQNLLDRLETELREILETARTQIAPLPAEDLLFRPAPSKPKAKESWNILECLAHLNAFSEQYFSRIDLAIHKAKAIAPYLKHLRSQGVTLYFLPPYSPELNRIEKLWHLMKHTWMAVKHRDAPTLEADVAEILDNFGTTYKMVF